MIYAKARDGYYKVNPRDTSRDESYPYDLYVRIVGGHNLIMTSAIAPLCPTVWILWETFR